MLVPFVGRGKVEEMNDFPHKQQDNKQKCSAFTLIELLVVISIIAILASLLMPAAQNAINSAYKTTAKNQVVQIATAITAYETEYGRLPAFTGTNMVLGNTAMLCTSNDASNNPRGLIFLDSSSWKKGKGGTNAGGFCDPFNSNSVYAVALDTNYANTLSNIPYQATNGGTVTTTNITKHIGVWTVWTNGSRTYLINSWD